MCVAKSVDPAVAPPKGSTAVLEEMTRSGVAYSIIVSTRNRASDLARFFRC